MTGISPSDLRDAWRGIGQVEALGLLGVSRRTWRRWLSGQARIPRSAYALGRALTGDLGYLGKAWEGWRVHRGLLRDPEGSVHTPAQVMGWRWTAQRLQALRADENTADTDSTGKVVSLRIAHAITDEMRRRVG